MAPDGQVRELGMECGEGRSAFSYGKPYSGRAGVAEKQGPVRSRGRENAIPSVCSLCSRSLLSREAFPQQPLELMSSVRIDLATLDGQVLRHFPTQVVTSTQVPTRQVSPSHHRYNLTAGTAPGLQDPTPVLGVTTIFFIKGHAAGLVMHLEYHSKGLSSNI